MRSRSQSSDATFCRRAPNEAHTEPAVSPAWQAVGVFRIVRGVAKDRVIPTVDTQARHGHKSRNRHVDGHKASCRSDSSCRSSSDSAVFHRGGTRPWDEDGWVPATGGLGPSIRTVASHPAEGAE